MGSKRFSNGFLGISWFIKVSYLICELANIYAKV